MNLVVDTSVLIDYLRGGILWEQIIESEKEAICHIPTIVIFELFSGKSSKLPQNAQKIKNILKYLERIELTEKIAKRAGELYRDVNKTLQAPDYIIAASCLSIGGSVVTLNVKHFQNIPGLQIYPN